LAKGTRQLPRPYGLGSRFCGSVRSGAIAGEPQTRGQHWRSDLALRDQSCDQPDPNVPVGHIRVRDGAVVVAGSCDPLGNAGRDEPVCHCSAIQCACGDRVANDRHFDSYVGDYGFVCAPLLPRWLRSDLLPDGYRAAQTHSRCWHLAAAADCRFTLAAYTRFTPWRLSMTKPAKRAAL